MYQISSTKNVSRWFFHLDILHIKHCDTDKFVTVPPDMGKAGVQKVGTAGTTGVEQSMGGWTKLNSEQFVVGHFIKRVKKVELNILSN